MARDPPSVRCDLRLDELVDDTPSASPDDYDDGGRRQDEYQRAEPALYPVDMFVNRLDMVGKEVGQSEGEGHGHEGSSPIGQQELPEGHARNTRGQKGRRAEPHEMAHGHDCLDRVS